MGKNARGSILSDLKIMRIYNVKINGISNPMGYAFDKLVLSYLVDGVPRDALVAHVYADEACTEELYEQTLDFAENFATVLHFSVREETRYYVVVTCGEVHSDPCILEGGTRFDCPFIFAEGIEHPVYFKEFALPEGIVRARLYVTGLGMYEAFVNGKKAGQEFLAPGCNDYSAYVQYQTYDVTELLSRENRLEIALGNGWYKGRFGLHHKENIYGSDFIAAAKLLAWTMEGERIELSTDESWSARPSYVQSSGIYDGEIVDRTADISRTYPVKRVQREIPVRARISLPIVEKQRLSPSLIVTPKGEMVLDFHQNFAGFVSFETPLSRGQKVTLKAGEILQQGCFYNANLRTARAEFVYISDGVFRRVRPQFTFFGLRYLLVEGIEDVRAEDFCGHVIYSDLDASVEIDVHEEKMNRLLQNCVWGQRGNFIDVPTDCPQRDERLGWTGDAEIFSRNACFQMDCRAFYDKYLTDLAIEQGYLGGGIPSYAPAFKECSTPAGSIWSDAATIVPWNVYKFYGDKQFLRRHFPMMQRYADYIIERDDMRGGGRLYNFGFHLGDWLSQDGAGPNALKGATNEYFIASAYYYNSVHIVAQAARVLDEACAEKYDKIAEEIKTAFFREYFTPSGRCAIDTQTAYVLCSEFDLYPDCERFLRSFSKRLKKDGYKIRGGFVGASQLIQNLFKCGFVEDAFRILYSESFPGWLYCVNLGATTIWERWNSLNADGSISGTEMNSFNHYSFGAVAEAFYAYIAGIEQREVAFKKVDINPRFNYRLPKLDMRLSTPAGEFALSYRLEGSDAHLSVTIPYGVEATLVASGKRVPLSVGENRMIIPTGHDFSHPFNIDCKLCDLLQNEQTQRVLGETVPNLYGFFKRNDIGLSGNTLREICAIDSFHVPDVILERINEQFSRINVAE